MDPNDELNRDEWKDLFDIRGKGLKALGAPQQSAVQKKRAADKQAAGASQDWTLLRYLAE